MAKSKTTFFCQNCGTQYAKWVGQCKVCKEWNTVVEEVIQKDQKETWKAATSTKPSTPKPVLLSDISTSKEYRLNIGSIEFNRVLGGGLVPGSVIFIGRRTRYWKEHVGFTNCLTLKSKNLIRIGRRK